MYSNNHQVRVGAFPENGSINADRAKKYAEQAKEQADIAKEQADIILREIGEHTDKTFTYEQAESSNEWVINHGLNKYPAVTVVDSAGNEVICSVQHLSMTTCVVEMTAPFKGKAILN